MRIPESKLAEVAAAADIVQVVSGYVDLKRAGKDFVGVCPFHGDKDPSLYVSPGKGSFYCFGCAAGGSVFSFLMKIENISFVEAVRILANRYGISFDFERGNMDADEKRERIWHALETAQQYFDQGLERSPSASEYLANRGVRPDWIQKLGLGFAPDSWDGMVLHLKKFGVDVRSALVAGILRDREGGGQYDYFRSRLMIPIRDLSGRLCAFGGRALGEATPKYLNSPESPVFSKRRLLYGLDSARDALRREGFAVLVEGYFDQISLRMNGIENVAAPLGTAIAPDQLRLVKRFCSNVTTVFDGDEAGIRAVKRAIPLFISEGFEPRCLILRQDKDPDEAVRRIGADGFRKLLDSAVPIVDFFLDSLESQHDLKTLKGRQDALGECVPLLREIADSTERDYLLEKFSSRLSVREERLLSQLKSPLRTAPKDSSRDEPTCKNLFDFPADERNVVRGMLLYQGFVDRAIDSGVIKDIRDPLLRLLAEKMTGFRLGCGHLDPSAFCSTLEDANLASLVAGWLQPRREEDDLRPEVAEVDADLLMEHSLKSIRIRKVKERMAEIKAKIKSCPPGEEEYNRLGAELIALQRSLGK
jgi:DNA primase